MSKKFLKKVTIVLLVMAISVAMALPVSAANIFNVTYSGVFSATSQCYYEITNNDCILEKVYVGALGSDTVCRWADASNASTVYMNSQRFQAVYKEGYTLTNLNGTITKKYSDGQELYIQSEDVELFHNTLGFLTQIQVTYNNMIYIKNC